MTHASNAYGADPVTIGALAPLSPPGWVEAGRHLVAGMALAVSDLGGGIELVVRDTAADPARAAAAVDELAGLGVAALAGEYHSVAARGAAARAEALGVPFLCSSAVLDALTDGRAEHVGRLAPPQSRGWRLYADFLRAAGHRRIAVAAQPSAYWEAGTRILEDRFAALTVLDAGALAAADVADAVADAGATALLLLVGTPEPAMPIVRAVRRNPRLAHVLVGAPAGQPEHGGWHAALGGAGAGIPFLRYLPDRLAPLGERVGAALRDRLGAPPSFVAFEGYDSIVALAEVVRGRSWATAAADGTRGPIRFERVPGIGAWQWAQAPIQIADRDPADPARFRVLRTA